MGMRTYLADEYHCCLSKKLLDSVLNYKYVMMSVLKVIEILGNSDTSFEDAVQNVINEVSKTVRDIKSVYIQDMQVTVENNQIAQYRINAKVTFGIQE